MQKRLKELEVVTLENRFVDHSFRKILIFCVVYAVLFNMFSNMNNTNQFSPSSNEEKFMAKEQTENCKKGIHTKSNTLFHVKKDFSYEELREAHRLAKTSNSETSLMEISDGEIFSSSVTMAEEDGKWIPQYVDDLQRQQDAEFQAELTNRGFPEYADEVDWLSMVLFYEVGNSTREDMIYTGSVVINRARTQYSFFKKYNTIYAVLHQSGQYSTIEKIDASMNKGEKASQECIEVAQGLIDGSIRCLEECVLFQLLHKPKSSLGKNLIDAILPGAHEYYGVPKDFWNDGIDRGPTWTSEIYPINLEEEP